MHHPSCRRAIRSRLFPVLLLATALTWFCPQDSTGQQMARQTYSRADGLPSDFVLDLMQDRRGFIWMATDAGVARYDGRTFQPFKFDGNRSSPLIYSLSESGFGTVYAAGFESGIARLSDGRFIDAGFADPGETVNFMGIDEEGGFLFRQGGSLHAVLQDSVHLIRDIDLYPGRQDLASIRPGLFATTSADSIFLVETTPHSVLVRSLLMPKARGGQYLESVDHSNPRLSATSIDTSTTSESRIAALSDGRILVSRGGRHYELWVLNPDGSDWQFLAPVSSRVRSLVQHPDGRILVGTSATLEVFRSVDDIADPTVIPVAFWMKASWSVSSTSLSTRAPMTTSECPAMYLVTECITISAPRSRGFCR